MSRVLLSTSGSAGDLFPLVPIARHLVDTGHEVLFAVPRSLGLYLRGVGIRSFALGTGNEMRAIQDPTLFGTRFAGWDSHRRALVNYIAPAVSEESAAVSTLISSWHPDVVVTTTFAAGPRIAALTMDVPHVTCSIYPHHYRLDVAGRSTGFAQAMQRAVRSVTPRQVLERHGIEMVAFGVDPSAIILSDRVLLGNTVLPRGAIVAGFPYWDEAAFMSADEEQANHWCEQSSRPVVVITLGSFIGATAGDFWEAANRAAKSCEARLLIVNARHDRAVGEFGNQAGVQIVGYVPFSRVLKLGSVLVHHGGIGTTFAAIRAACPSLIVPQAFDQPYVAMQVKSAGLGEVTTARGLEESMSDVLASGGMQANMRRAAETLIPSWRAAETAAHRILDQGTRDPKPGVAS